MQSCDLVLLEGFKDGRYSKLEVWRWAVGRPTLWPEWPNILAIASDAPVATTPHSAGRQFAQLDLADTAAIAAFALSNAAAR